MHPLDDAADLVKYWEATPIKWEVPSECCTAPTLTTDNSAAEKLEKHVDELEEDIEFFNKQLKAQEIKVAAIESKQCLQKMEYNSEIARLEAKIDELNEALAHLNINLNNLESKLEGLNGKS